MTKSLLLLLLLLMPTGSMAAALAESGNFVVENLEDGERLCYPLAILRGRYLGSDAEIRVGIASEEGSMRAFPAAAGYFKAVALLRPGRNRILLQDSEGATNFHLEYFPRESDRWVRLVYLLASDGDGSFDAPDGEPNDLESAIRRLATAGLLLQAAIAEKLKYAGRERKTIRLVSGADGYPEVSVVRLPIPMAQLHGMTGFQLFDAASARLASMPARSNTKDLAVMAFTRFDPNTKTVKAHTALGGGSLALFGSGNMSAWAQSLDEVSWRFADARKVDVTRFHNDSVNGSAGSNFAVGLGAMLHELGHALGLPHTDGYPSQARQGIMWRGFEEVNLAFALRNPGESRVRYGADRAFWHPESAKLLDGSAWIGSEGTLAFSNWIRSFERVPEARRAMEDDPDGDGWGNFQEYALGTRPDLADPPFELSGNPYPALRYMRNPVASGADASEPFAYENAAIGARFAIEASNDLRSWRAADASLGEPVELGEGRWEAPVLPAAGPPGLFFRVRAEQFDPATN